MAKTQKTRSRRAHGYTAYGLGIRSSLVLPELVPADLPADVVIRKGPVAGPRPAPDVMSRCVRASARRVCLYWKGVGMFSVAHGREIVIDARKGTPAAVLRLFLLGPVLGMLLHQRGALVLHASALRMGDGVAAFLGGPRWGKSTTAAVLHQRGHALVADDVTAVDTQSAGLMVEPAVPRLKLWPEAAAHLGHDPESLPRLRAELEKRDRPVTEAFESRAFPLRRLYVLAEGPRIKITRLKPQAAFMELVKHSYLVGLLKRTGSMAEHFRQCGRVVGAVPVSRLTRPLKLEQLAELARQVEEDVVL
ncbi:MAG: hypothetical protein KKC51_11325 [Verrucomicrobia bacterium]|nr:hypothetical protein [Verrucomicrobiota bacterium]